MLCYGVSVMLGYYCFVLVFVSYCVVVLLLCYVFDCVSIVV